MKVVAMALICGAAFAASGCVQKTFDVRAYDLKGEKIYEGQLVRRAGSLETADGKTVAIINATVIMEEVK